MNSSPLSSSGSEEPTPVISTGVPGLDDILVGGLRVGHLYLFDGEIELPPRHLLRLFGTSITKCMLWRSRPDTRPASWPAPK